MDVVIPNGLRKNPLTKVHDEWYPLLGRTYVLRGVLGSNPDTTKELHYRGVPMRGKSSFTDSCLCYRKQVSESDERIPRDGCYHVHESQSEGSLRSSIEKQSSYLADSSSALEEIVSSIEKSVPPKASFQYQQQCESHESPRLLSVYLRSTDPVDEFGGMIGLEHNLSASLSATKRHRIIRINGSSTVLRRKVQVRVPVGQLLCRHSMGRAHQSHRSSVNTFACSDVKIQMRPTCVGGLVVTRSPRMSDVRGSNPGTATGHALLMSSNKSETRVQCFPLVWTHRNNYARTGGRPFKREWLSSEDTTTVNGSYAMPYKFKRLEVQHTRVVEIDIRTESGKKTFTLLHTTLKSGFEQDCLCKLRSSNAY
ncbi:hypothetical protein CLF_112168 [Clonorchis sinensis]|uniref:Uncharacterized protein n=1 Tax=Clonorchis sinensis TaxID=79923 RepID=G7YMB8_CLOSI|nr:hypothetical protein CLF_112168 [Clonorchis sinensis]